MVRVLISVAIVVLAIAGVSFGGDIQMQGLNGSWNQLLNLPDGCNQVAQSISAVSLDQALQDSCASLGQTITAMVALNASNSGGGQIIQGTNANGDQTQYSDPVQSGYYEVDVTQILLGPGNKTAATSAIVAGSQTNAGGGSFLGQTTFIGITEFASGVGTQVQNSGVVANQFQAN